MTVTPKERLRWRRRNSYYYRVLERLVASWLGHGGRVLDLDADLGDALAALRPTVGIGITRTSDAAAAASRRFPDLRFVAGDPRDVPIRGRFDAILLLNAIGSMTDIAETLGRVRELCHERTRVLLTYYNFVWEPILKLGERLGMKQPEPDLNWLGMADIRNVLQLAGYAVDASGARLLVPKEIPVISGLAEGVLMRSRAFQALALVQYFVARPRAVPPSAALSTTVVVPVRNEVGNVDACLARMPRVGARTEVIFVDGASTDGTRERIGELIAGQVRPDLEVKVIDQTPEPMVRPATGRVTMLAAGKGDAVRRGFDAASGDVLMILDGDLTVPPEDLPRFYEPIARGEAGLVTGSRLVYPLEEGAMRMVNLAANRAFGIIFTWLLRQRIKDTLCGTKALRLSDYRRIASARGYFGDFDPFGDFDLLFGAARLGMRITEVPVRYRRRTFGKTKIRALEHGLLLSRMVGVALWKLRVRPALSDAIRRVVGRGREGATDPPTAER